jgi:prevent-host-death family protein
MRSMHDTNYKGNVAEMVIATAAMKLGVDVMKPLGEHTRYDLIFDLGGRLLRVQCKWAPLEGDVVTVRLVSSRYTSAGRQVCTVYTPDEVDAAAAYCEELDECYLITADMFDGMKRGLSLRVAPPRNGQRAQLNWAADYLLSGAVAQLGRAPEWHSGGRGFESHQLHSSTEPGKEVVGAHDFRNRFGWYMERAAAGEEFFVTRRGKPYVRLVPARDQLDLTAAARNGGPAGP